MNVPKIDNQPVFGIKFINKQMWNGNFIKSFEQLDLVKQIDKKYPKASASYRKTIETDVTGSKPNYHLNFKINLKNNRERTFIVDSESSSSADNSLLNILKNISIVDIEKESSKKRRIQRIFSGETRMEKLNPIAAEFKKLWFKIKLFYNY